MRTDSKNRSDAPRPRDERRRDPLNNPAERRLEPVPSESIDGNRTGPIRTQKQGRGNAAQAMSESEVKVMLAGSSHPRTNVTKRVSVPLQNKARCNNHDANLPLHVLPVPLTFQQESDLVGPPSNPAGRAPQHVPGDFDASSGGVEDTNSLLGADLIAHAHSEAGLFIEDIQMESDAEEVKDMLNPQSFDKGKSALVRKRPAEDDGSHLRGRDSRPGMAASPPATFAVSSASGPD